MGGWPTKKDKKPALANIPDRLDVFMKALLPALFAQ
jgi:hypothetical protein